MDWLNRLTGKSDGGFEYHRQREQKSNQDSILIGLMNENGRARIEFWNPQASKVERLDGKIISINPHTHVMIFKSEGREVRLMTSHVKRAWRLRTKPAEPRNPPHPSGPHDVTHGPVGQEIDPVTRQLLKYPGYPPGMQGDDPFTWRMRREWDKAKAEQEAHEEQERQRRGLDDPYLFRRPMPDALPQASEQTMNPNNLPGQYLPSLGSDETPGMKARREEYERFKRLGGTTEEWVGKYGKWPNGNYRRRHELSSDEANSIDQKWNNRYGPDAEPHETPAPQAPPEAPKPRRRHDDAT